MRQIGFIWAHPGEQDRICLFLRLFHTTTPKNHNTFASTTVCAMLKKIFTLLIATLLLQGVIAQPAQNTLPRPKLVVGLVVDQMRWDFLYRYYDRYSSGGFKRLLNEGFSCENTFIPYTPSVTAAGHTCVYTGSVPAVHGIAGNAWYDRSINRQMYCSEDTSVTSVGGDARNGKMSPANLLTTTITDELRLATNFKSKVVGVCIKDRGSIFPAGRRANAAFWYDGKTGNWITSTWYMNELPGWLQTINNSKPADAYYKKNWNTLYPIATYTQSTADELPYEVKTKGDGNTSFPHKLEGFVGKDYSILPGTPYGNSITLDMARAVLANYALGKSGVTDFLAVSLSSPDYVGHQFGPNSIEVEDTYLRLDADLAAFLKHLDETVGKGQYTVFLTADHGVAHVPGFMLEHKLAAGNWEPDSTIKDMNALLKEKFGMERLILAESNYQLYLDHKKLATADAATRTAITQFIISECRKMKGVADVFELSQIAGYALPQPIHQMMINGYHKKRGGDIQLLLEPGWIDGGKTGTTHGLWNPYDTHLPMLWMGWGIKKGASNTQRYMTDIAPTLAALLHIQMPNGCVGQVMTEVLK
jgi:predicted AlkP superfamily pyrophosphatase or phosphodiesterase